MDITNVSMRIIWILNCIFPLGVNFPPGVRAPSKDEKNNERKVENEQFLQCAENLVVKPAS